jgi:hypothetical protein
MHPEQDRFNDSSSMAEGLRDRFRAIPVEQRDANQAFSIRVWRAISWLGRSSVGYPLRV